MKILKDILSIDNNIKFEKNAFDKYVNKFADLQLHDTNQFPMTTRGKKILYYSIFIKVFPDDASIEKKKRELESLHNADYFFWGGEIIYNYTFIWLEISTYW